MTRPSAGAPARAGPGAAPPRVSRLSTSWSTWAGSPIRRTTTTARGPRRASSVSWRSAEPELLASAGSPSSSSPGIGLPYGDSVGWSSDLQQLALDPLAHHVLPAARLLVHVLPLQADHVDQQALGQPVLAHHPGGLGRPSSVSSRWRSPATCSSPSRSIRATVWETVGPALVQPLGDPGAQRDDALLLQLEDGAEVHLGRVDQVAHAVPSPLLHAGLGGPRIPVARRRAGRLSTCRLVPDTCSGCAATCGCDHPALHAAARRRRRPGAAAVRPRPRLRRAAPAPGLAAAPRCAAWTTWTARWWSGTATRRRSCPQVVARARAPPACTSPPTPARTAAAATRGRAALAATARAGAHRHAVRRGARRVTKARRHAVPGLHPVRPGLGDHGWPRPAPGPPGCAGPAPSTARRRPAEPDLAGSGCPPVGEAARTTRWQTFLDERLEDYAARARPARPGRRPRGCPPT